MTSALNQYVESYRFWGIVVLQAKERLEHEEIVARAMAAAVVRDGLILNSIDPRWVKARASVELKGHPYVAYRPVIGGEMMVLRAKALEHLLSIVRKAEPPSRQTLH